MLHGLDGPSLRRIHTPAAETESLTGMHSGLL